MYIGIDIGGSNIRIASFSEVINPQLLKKVSFPVERNFDRAIPLIVERIHKMTKNEKIEGVGVTLPGIVNSKEGFIESSVNLSEWDKKPVMARLSQALDSLVKCEQDVAAGALGEALYGAGKDTQKFVFIIWGTGFGGATVEKQAGQIKVTQLETGHQIYDWNGPKCPCGQNGCFELYIGGGFLKKLHGIDPAGIGDEDTWNDLAQKASHALINMVMNQPTDLIVYSGGLITMQPHLLSKIGTIFQQKQSIFKQPKHVMAELGGDAGLFGAIGLFK